LISFIRVISQSINLDTWKGTLEETARVADHIASALALEAREPSRYGPDDWDEIRGSVQGRL
jgi:hypothetical protein